MAESETSPTVATDPGADRLSADLRVIQRTGLASVAANLLLAAVKLGTGALIGSVALIGDGVHSFSDLLTDFVVLVAARLGSQPADETHPWGHGKYETFGVLIIALAVIAAGVEIGWIAGGALSRGEVHYPGPLVLVVAAFSVALKEVLYRVSRRAGEQTRSQVLIANAWHHRSDALSSLVVLAAGVLSLAGWGHADQAAGIIVGLMVVVVGVRFGWEAIGELMEKSAGGEVETRIAGVLDRAEAILGWHKLRTRNVGRELFIDLHVVVPSKMTVVEADCVTHRVEKAIRRELDRPCNVMVHIDPEKSDCR